MDYKVIVEEIEEMHVASIRFKGAYGEIGKHIALIFKEVKGMADGAPFCLFHDDHYAEIADIEVCIPTKGLIETKDATAKSLPAIKAISTVHIGKYSNLSLAYKALAEYADANGLKTFTPSREVYIKGPGMILKGNPDKYETEVILPIRKL